MTSKVKPLISLAVIVGEEEKPLVGIENLTVFRGTKKVLNKINLNLNSGEIIILEGENGSGKSTLIEAIAKIIPSNHGIVKLNGTFGLTLQKNGINEDELVSERISYAMMVSNGDPKNMDSILEHWNMSHRKSDKIAHLSFGMKRKIAMMQGLMPGYCSNSPTFSLLDEPTEGLDKRSVKLLIDDLLTLANKGHGFIIATHDSRISEIATKKCLIDEGNIETQNYKLSIKHNHKLPIISEKKGGVKLAKKEWSKTITQRTKLPFLKRGLPLLTSILVILGIVSGLNRDTIPENIAGGLILLPGFLAALIKPAELEYLQENRCGDWWKAMSPDILTTHTTILEMIFVFFAPLVTSLIVLNGNFPDDKLLFIVCSLTILLVMFANNSIYSLAENMPRKNSTYIPLLTIILIWPFLITSNMILNDRFENSINEMILVLVIPSIIFLITPILSKK
ncbi:MAG: hypothetical protein CMB64_06435 [Euryarchaeota archaeon]|nr:hypothetical protein [Euryarchaeota archaeon]